MVEREGYNLRFTDDVLDIDQTDLGAAAVKRYLSVITHYENTSLGNFNIGIYKALTLHHGVTAFIIINIRFVNLYSVHI